MEPITKIADSLGIDPDHLIPYGRYKAKISLDALKNPSGQKGRLVVVTGITPTPAGEGKTTTAIGLTQGMGRLGHKVSVNLREPTLGPIFGIKGGGTGGGMARVVPEDEINIHFTGDAHAVGSAHNLLAALVENAVFRNSVPGLNAGGIMWNRVTDASDRGLRQVVTGVGGPGYGPLREARFDIVSASEIMAILALADGPGDLRDRLSRIVVGETSEGEPVTVEQLGVAGSLMTLLHQTVMPNLVQTMEGQPSIIHAGPFGNIAHGCSSILADRMAMGYADYVITEAGFASDLGFEKFMHIKTRQSGLLPAAAVLVASARALKWHGGTRRRDLANPDPQAVVTGGDNLIHHIGIVKGFGLPCVVAINRFGDDSAEELAAVKKIAMDAGATSAVECDGFAQGGPGGEELAQAVVDATEGGSPEITYAYASDASAQDKVLALAQKIYGAADVTWSPEARRRLQYFESKGWGGLPICMAKTHLSISHDQSLKGRPQGYTFPITDIRASVGAGFLYALAGRIETLPGLPTHPRALDMDVTPEGEVLGLS
ncbi:MAG: formate--tetrahydrofolate ligase [Chloroflexi bacterium]|nr:formate--tetrahydrofolate ligase [Chloroflexota bacterium]MDA1272005.1 formate--tetrahydrofolate ligase [Chloroflexota bacterium]PKB59196.1 MAG: formate--tetrahydrofolate ligase [SAR202 cluster bacterium Casp-Chloro-G2]